MDSPSPKPPPTGPGAGTARPAPAPASGSIGSPPLATTSSHLVARGPCLDLEEAAGHVVMDAVVEQVGDQPFEQAGVAGGPGRLEVVADLDLRLLGPRPQVGDAVAGERGDVDGLLVTGGRLAARQQQQAGDQPLAAVDGVTHGLAHLAQLLGAGVGVGERHVDLGAHDGQGRAQLVRGVGDEVALAGEGAVQPAEHAVEGVGELAELVGGPRQVDPLAEVLARDAPCRGGDLAQGRERASGEQPADDHRDRRHRDESARRTR